jgi:hypothetical protein
MSSINIFLKQENITLLWNIIKDEKLIKSQSNEIINEILLFFKNNITSFYEKEHVKCKNLIEINKKYIVFVLDYIKYKYFNSTKNTNRIKIHEDILVKNKELITYEELQKEKLNVFEKELSIKEEDFKNYMHKPVPPTPVFNDDINEVPISEFNEIIKQITIQRNYDIENINTNQSNSSFLQSQETSIKNEKLIKQSNNETTNKKNITWGNDTVTEYEENDKININNENIELNIFDKLKQNTNTKINDNSNKNIEEQIEKIQNDIIIINLKINKILNILKI